MNNFLVLINTIEKVREFSKIALEYEDYILVSTINNDYVTKGSSIIGLFSLDITQPLKVTISDFENIEEIYNKLEKFIYIK